MGVQLSLPARLNGLASVCLRGDAPESLSGQSSRVPEPKVQQLSFNPEPKIRELSLNSETDVQEPSLDQELKVQQPSHPFPVHRTERKPATEPGELGDDGKPVGIAAAATLRSPFKPLSIALGTPLERLVELVERFLHRGPGDQFDATGRAHLSKTLSTYIQNQEKIMFVFPAFPFKSPSKKKVLGDVPDYGEELVLRRLETLARMVEDYHPAGAVVCIVSDGVVYGTLLGREESTIYQYNAKLRKIVTEQELSHIKFAMVSDLLDPSPTLNEDYVTEEEYVQSVPLVREQFLAHEVANFDLDHALAHDSASLMIYRGYLKFLIADLEGSELLMQDGKPLSGKGQERVRRDIARKMIVNGAKFSDLVALKFPTSVRLSCHAHNNAGPKFAFDLFPGSPMKAPWHNTVLEKVDGSLAVGHLSSFGDPSSYEVVYRDGAPYYLREMSDDRDLGEKINAHVTFERLFPFGLAIVADPQANLSFNDLPMKKIRALSLRYSVVLFRGFSQVNRDELIQKSSELGTIVTWPAYGAVLELKENPSLDINSSLTCEAMPMHYDGCFKTKRDANGELTHDPPQFQVFQCIDAPDGNQGGQTLLSNTVTMLEQGLTAEQRQWLANATFSLYTPQNQVFGGDHLKLPLVMKNEATGHDIFRWHESWPQHITKFRPTLPHINDITQEDSSVIGDYLTDLLYDRRFCYAHTWTTGDFLIADNHELMHTRSAFTPCPRELWRVHVN
ncbi:Clavaminate synthase-like protein [Pluteus cervinus]|uniref:Clavaminate synthase-like protein n=1 Tax=Pluteus cervinus TaxID=181527 RepID=A0ACD3ADF5_9AGAR|nr:Clavaminate synthase-like protein [Pluteus cervinus]